MKKRSWPCRQCRLYSLKGPRTNSKYGPLRLNIFLRFNYNMLLRVNLQCMFLILDEKCWYYKKIKYHKIISLIASNKNNLHLWRLASDSLHTPCSTLPMSIRRRLDRQFWNIITHKIFQLLVEEHENCVYIHCITQNNKIAVL